MRSDSIREKHIKQTLEKINSIENMVDRPVFNTQKEETTQIEIKIDKKVAHGMFIPSKAIPGIWYASEQTFKAMKKDIFTLGGSLDEIAQPFQCESCKTDIDKQFWNFCPFCQARFSE